MSVSTAATADHYRQYGRLGHLQEKVIFVADIAILGPERNLIICPPIKCLVNSFTPHQTFIVISD